MLKCGHCGNTNSWELERFSDDTGSMVHCKHCQSLTPLLEGANPKAGEYRRLCDEGTRLLKDFNFEAAMRNFREAEALFPGTHRALWGQISAYYGVAEIDSAIERRPGEALCRWMYAKKIAFEKYEAVEKLRSRIAHDITLRQVYAPKLMALEQRIRRSLDEAGEEPFYDVYLACKSTTASDSNIYAMERTAEYRTAFRLYDAFRNNGIRVFFAEHSLPNAADRTDEKILSAMIRSRFMILVSGSERNEEYLESPWIRCDWTRWIGMEKRGLKAENSLYIYSITDAHVPYPFRMEEEGLEVTLPQGERAMMKAIEEAARKAAGTVDEGKTKQEPKAEEQQPQETMQTPMQASSREKKGCRIGWWMLSLIVFVAILGMGSLYGISFGALLPLIILGLVVLAITSKIRTKRSGRGGLWVSGKSILVLLLIAGVIFSAIFIFNLLDFSVSDYPPDEAITQIHQDVSMYEFSYTVYDNSWVRIEGYRNPYNVDDLHIPSYIEGYPVLEIAPYAFSGSSEIWSVYIPETVWYIGEGAFYQSGVTDVYAANNAELVIGAFAFAECYNLQYLNLSAREIQAWCFLNCTNLNEVYFYSLPQYLPRDAFCGCSNLTRVSTSEYILLSEWIALYGTTVPFADNIDCDVTVYCWDEDYCYTMQSEGSVGLQYKIDGGNAIVTGIGSCPGSEIYVPEFYMGYPVTEIGDGALAGGDFAVIYLPSTIRRIGLDAFSRSSVHEVYFSSGELEICTKAFYECMNLRTVYLEESSLSIIYSEAFTNCIALSSISLPASVIGVYEYAFSGCTSLERVIFRGMVGKIEEGVFNHCPSLTFINCEAMTCGDWIALYGETNRAFADGTTQVVEVACPDGSLFYEDPSIKGESNLLLVQAIRDALQNGEDVYLTAEMEGDLVYTEDLLSYDSKVGGNVAISIPEGVSVTLDLGGRTLVTDDETIAIAVYGSLVIRNGSVSTCGITVFSEGRLNLEGVTIETTSRDGGAAITNHGGFVEIKNGCTLMTRGEYINAKTSCLSNSGRVTIHDGSFIARNTGFAIVSTNGELMIYSMAVEAAHGGILIKGGVTYIESCYVNVSDKTPIGNNVALLCEGGSTLFRSGTLITEKGYAVEFTGAGDSALSIESGELFGDYGDVLGKDFSGFFDGREGNAEDPLVIDQRTVEEMNQMLLLDPYIENIGNVLHLLRENGYTHEDAFVPRSEGYAFYWNPDANRIYLVNDDYKSVISPVDGYTYDVTWYNLAAEGVYDYVYVGSSSALEYAIQQGIPQIYLTRNIVLSRTLVLDKNVYIELHLSGYRLDATGAYDYAFELYDGSTLILHGEGGEIVCASRGLINVPSSTSCSITLNDGFYVTNATNGSLIRLDPSNIYTVNVSMNNVSYTDYSGSGFIVDARSFSGALNLYVIGGTFYAYAGFDLEGNGICYVESATITTSAYAFLIASNDEVVLRDSTITTGKGMIDGSPLAAVIAESGAIVHVSKCTINAEGTAYYVDVTGGTIIASENSTWASIVASNAAGENGSIVIDNVEVD